MIEINIWALIAGFVAAMGIPSAIRGLIVWRIKKRADKREQEIAEREDAREQLLVLFAESVGASLALGEATARAVQRIPDAHCNGDMHEALANAVLTQGKLSTFLSKQGVHSTF